MSKNKATIIAVPRSFGDIMQGLDTSQYLLLVVFRRAIL